MALMSSRASVVEEARVVERWRRVNRRATREWRSISPAGCKVDFKLSVTFLGVLFIDFLPTN